MAEQGKEGMLPKNIRQIGQISGNQKIYLEDYVITYLRQILTPDENMRGMILYGHKEMIEDELYWFVNGAVEAQHDFFMEKTIIDEESWKKVNDMTRKYLELENAGAEFEELEKLTLGGLRKAVVEGAVKNGSVMAGQIAGMV